MPEPLEVKEHDDHAACRGIEEPWRERAVCGLAVLAWRMGESGAYGLGCEGLEEFGVAFRFVQSKASDLEFEGLLRASRVTLRASQV